MRSLSSPDDALWVSPRRLPVEYAVEDGEGFMDAVGLDPGDGFLLLLEEGVGD